MYKLTLASVTLALFLTETCFEAVVLIINDGDETGELCMEETGDTGDTGETGESCEEVEVCLPGAENCSCMEGSCEAGLSCVDDICQCPVGVQGCQCTLQGECDAGLTCVQDTCKKPG